MKRNLMLVLLLLALSLSLQNCEITEAEIDHETMLDGNMVFDSLSYLVSDSFPNPSDSLKQVPVVIAVHGFTATTYEWLDFSNFRDSTQDFLLSRVLLGGHGRNYKAFKESSWEDWQKPIMDEYKRLSDLGFENITLAGSSTGGALIVEMLERGFFKNLTQPKNLIMVDAIVVPGAKILSLVDMIGPIIGNSISTPEEEELAHWYANRPQEALYELFEVINKIRHRLEDGLNLPSGTNLYIYKSKGDKVADPISGLIMYKGLKNSGGGEKKLKMLDSPLHVFTRLSGRNTIRPEDLELQQRVFQEIRSLTLGESIKNPL